MTVNRCRMRLRGSRPPSADWDELADKLQTADPGHDPQFALQQSEMRQALWNSVDALADHHRLVVLLRYLYDLPYREIAQVLEISEGTVKSRLYTAHRRLRQKLAARGATQEPVQAEEWQTP